MGDLYPMTYRAGVLPKDLAVDECTIHKHEGYPADVWLLAFRFRRVTDGKTEQRFIPVRPGTGPLGGGAWGLIRKEDDDWQVIPSIRCLDYVPDPADPTKKLEIELWHQNVALVGVPVGEPWQLY